MTAQSRPENASTQPLRFGQYVLLDRINVGGMAEVFKAKAFGVEGFEKIVAIKRILPTMSEDDEFIKMFVDEARITVQLHHENIVQVHELGRESGQYYIAMEYVSGRDMRQVLDAMKKQEDKKAAYSRRRTHVDDADFHHISERNRVFNAKMDRSSSTRFRERSSSTRFANCENPSTHSM